MPEEFGQNLFDMMITLGVGVLDMNVHKSVLSAYFIFLTATHDGRC